jgi:leucyl-tRNA synthetase
MTVAVQVNGKVRGMLTIQVSEKDDKALLEKRAREIPGVQKFLIDQQVSNIVIVPGRIVSFVTRPL